MWHLASDKFGIAVVECLQLCPELWELGLCLAYDVDERDVLPVTPVDECVCDEYGAELLLCLLVCEHGVDDVEEVIIDEHSSEIKYQILYHSVVVLALLCSFSASCLSPSRLPVMAAVCVLFYGVQAWKAQMRSSTSVIRLSMVFLYSVSIFFW